MNPSRPDVVFDCNVLLQAATRAGGPAAAALRLMDANRIALHLSKPILREFRRTLEYPEIRSRNPNVTDEHVEEFIAHLLFRGVLCRVVPKILDLPRDPNDEAYLDLAAAVEADYLVTRDNDLLSLPSEHTVEAKAFRQRLPKTRIVTPVDFLAAFP
jgi:putative PIN family toxin of toxin-antitoxin system